MADATDDRLRLLIERIERLEEEKKGIADDIRDVYAEAKAVGYDPKIMRQVVRLRKMKPDDRNEMEMVLDTYKAALGLGGIFPIAYYRGNTARRRRLWPVHGKTRAELLSQQHPQSKASRSRNIAESWSVK